MAKAVTRGEMVRVTEEWSPGFHQVTFGDDPKDAMIAELRAVLAPLLDDPTRYDTYRGWVCVFCDDTDTEAWDERHKPDCLTHRADALLGRTPQ